MKPVQFTSRGQIVYGWAHPPVCAGRAPVLVLCHGFTGNAAESARKFVRLAVRAATMGYYVLRFDCLGSGNSELSFAEYTTISGWVEDQQAAVRFAASQPEADPARIAILGHSMGGAAALLTAAMPEVRAAVLWSPAADAANVFRGITGEALWQELLHADRPLEGSFGGEPFTLTRRFAGELEALDLYAAPAACPGKPMLVIQGAEDAVVPPESTERLRARWPAQIEYHLLEGEEHDLNRRTAEVFNLTLDFLRRAL